MRIHIFFYVYLVCGLVWGISQPPCDNALKIMQDFSDRTNRPTISRSGLNLRLGFLPPQVTEVSLASVISQLKLRQPTNERDIPAIKFMAADPLGQFIVIKFADEWQPSFLPYAKQVYIVLKKVIINPATGQFEYELFSRFFISPHLKIKRLIFSERSSKIVLHLLNANTQGSKATLNVVDLRPGWSPDVQQMRFELDQVIDQVLFFENPLEPTNYLLAVIKPNSESSDDKLIRFISYSSINGRMFPLGPVARLPKIVHDQLILADSDLLMSRAFSSVNLSKETFIIKSPFFTLEQKRNGELAFTKLEKPIQRVISSYQPWISHEYANKWGVLSIYNSFNQNSDNVTAEANPIQFSLLKSLPWGAMIATPGNGYLFQDLSYENQPWMWFPPHKSQPIRLENTDKIKHTVVWSNIIIGVKQDPQGIPRLIFIDIVPQLDEGAN